MKVYPAGLSRIIETVRDVERLGGWYSHFDRETGGVDGRDMLGLSRIETWGRSDTLLSPDPWMASRR
jgi:hypothetical protein